MTVQKNLVKNIYIGNASATKFAITFDIPESHPEYLRVYIGSGSNVEETKNYTADLKAKTITYPKSGEPLPTGQKIIIMRELPLSQLLDLVNQGNYYAEDVEDALDILTLIAQQISEKLSRALVFNVDIDTSMFDNIIPFEAGKSFRVSDDGTHIETTEDPAKVLPIAESLLAQTTQQATIAIQQAAAAAGSALSAADSETNADTAMTQARNSAVLSQKWAESSDSPDGQKDADSPTGKTMSSKDWALYAKALALKIGNPVVSTTESNGTITVQKSDGSKNTINIVKSVNNISVTNGNVDLNMKFFNSLSQLGLAYATVTFETLYNAMPNNSMLVIPIGISSGGAYTAPNLKAPHNGTLVIRKPNTSAGPTTFDLIEYATPCRRSYARYGNTSVSTQTGFSGWITESTIIEQVQNNITGYIKYADGRMKQWGQVVQGTITKLTDVSKTVNYPQPFANNKYQVKLTTVIGGNNWADVVYKASTNSTTALTVGFWTQNFDCSNITLQYEVNGWWQ